MVSGGVREGVWAGGGVGEGVWAGGGVGGGGVEEYVLWLIRPLTTLKSSSH